MGLTGYWGTWTLPKGKGCGGRATNSNDEIQVSSYLIKGTKD